MPWQWVNDLLGQEGKKKDYGAERRCPYHLCPSNQPLGVQHSPRLKFMQRVSPLVYQYRCKDCGCLVNFGVEVPDDRGINGIKHMNPLLWGGERALRHVSGYNK